MKEQVPKEDQIEVPKQMMTNRLQEHESTLDARAIKEKPSKHLEGKQCKAKEEPPVMKSQALDDQTNAR